jgi:hypothetical protein
MEEVEVVEEVKERLCGYRKCKKPLPKGFGTDFCNDMHRVQERALAIGDESRLKKGNLPYKDDDTAEAAERIFGNEQEVIDN